MFPFGPKPKLPTMGNQETLSEGVQSLTATTVLQGVSGRVGVLGSDQARRGLAELRERVGERKVCRAVVG